MLDNKEKTKSDFFEYFKIKLRNIAPPIFVVIVDNLMICKQLYMMLMKNDNIYLLIEGSAFKLIEVLLA